MEFPIAMTAVPAFSNQPIVARATPAGMGGIGILRVSGASADVAGLIEVLLPKRRLEPRHAHLVALKDASGVLIDRVIVIHFPAPHSYTGESVLEIQAHGGIAVLNQIQELLLKVGESWQLRLARPGEFTERAFLNGRLDLAQAEAVADLIDAGSSAAARAAARSLSGAFSDRISELNASLLEVRTYVEATLDFPEEDVQWVKNGEVVQKVEALLKQLDAVEAAAMRGKVLRDGLHVVLAGAPNVGKSSLLNALCHEEVAIVTEIAGTTRDRIEVEVSLGDVTVKVTDTAGLQETTDKVESIGIERTLAAVRQADVVLLCEDATAMENAGSRDALAILKPNLREGVKFLTVVNKMDIAPRGLRLPEGAIPVSAKSGVGLEELTRALASIAGAEDGAQGDFLARSRHLACLSRAKGHLTNSLGSLRAMTLEIAAEDLRLAGNALGEIVGECLPDDLLGRIFSTFCIGK